MPKSTSRIISPSAPDLKVNSMNKHQHMLTILYCRIMLCLVN